MRTGAEIKRDLNNSPTGFAGKEAFRYETRYGRNKARHPVPDPAWQLRVYMEEMRQEPPDESYEQFQYNPRTKAGKALLSDLVASHG